MNEHLINLFHLHVTVSEFFEFASLLGMEREFYFEIIGKGENDF